MSADFELVNEIDKLRKQIWYLACLRMDLRDIERDIEYTDRLSLPEYKEDLDKIKQAISDLKQRVQEDESKKEQTINTFYKQLSEALDEMSHL